MHDQLTSREARGAREKNDYRKDQREESEEEVSLYIALARLIICCARSLSEDVGNRQHWAL